MKTRRKRSSQQQAQLEQQLEHYTTQASSRLPQGERQRQPGAWVSYAAAAGAALAMAPVADAVPVYSGPQNIMLTAPAGTTFYAYRLVDLNGDGMEDLSLALLRGFPSTSFNIAVLAVSGYMHTDGNYGVRKFASGEVIGPTTATASGGALRGTVLGMNYGQFTPSVNAFAGVQFYGSNTAAGSYPLYAWLRVHVRDDANGLPDKITLVDWAFDTEPIAAGDIGPTAVPEPSTGSLALLAMGAVGLYEWRRRRKQRAPRD